MHTLTFIVPEEYEGCRLKGFLRGHCHVSARLLVKLKRVENGLCVNEEHATAITILHSGDKVTLHLPEDQETPIAEEVPISILYEDDHLLAVNKPAGMAMYPVPGSNSGTLSNAVAFHWSEKGEILRFRPVYRLDKNTSGVVIIAKNSYIAAALSHNIQKEYIAVCEGLLQGCGTVSTPITLAPGSKIKRAVSSSGETAVTHWESIKANNEFSFLKIRIETGRTHQIRVHLSSIFHPLAGDDLYGGRLYKIKRQALHCHLANFIHPVTGKTILLQAPVPEDFVLLLQELDVPIA
ncbi:MAG: RluA family pseudouridine synthase [Clostridium sp.]|uniref:RluA family pseudouridine synthase n=1 Tax=Clostridium sp. TaxID=1506 RepID=UPI00290B5F4E|nr:RluA family pseudouridine synthase [Clostridium sp.]MDU7337239.1 RluA family pseudouridine synthase [Clostridium sp.]